MLNIQSFKQEPIICISLDTDWCKPFGVEYAMNLLSKYDLPATFFCTGGEYNIPSPHEQGIHPCINDHRRADLIMKPVESLRVSMPQARGNRCHRLEMNSFLYTRLPDMGFDYDSSWPMIGTVGITPLILYSGLVELPIFYTDHDFIMARSLDPFEKAFLAPGLKVLLFHPGHIYHNTGAKSYDALNQIPQAERFKPELIQDGFGLAKIFEHVMHLINKHELKCITCAQAADAMLENCLLKDEI